MSTSLEARSLVKTYDANDVPAYAVRGVDLMIDAGELVAIMGPSGCGKSTLLHMLGGIARPTAGAVLVGGRSLGDLDDDALASFRGTEIGFVFQAHNLLPSLTARENVSLPSVLAGRPPKSWVNRVNDLLDDLNLASIAERKVAQLSGGEQQRVAIARALLPTPTILLADEPTGSLDSTTGYDVLRLIRQVHRTGQTVVVATHDAKVAGIADRIIHMRDGLLTGEHVPGVASHIDHVIGRIVDTGDL